jgi:hypothetical protein
VLLLWKLSPHADYCNHCTTGGTLSDALVEARLKQQWGIFGKIENVQLGDSAVDDRLAVPRCVLLYHCPDLLYGSAADCLYSWHVSLHIVD